MMHKLTLKSDLGDQLLITSLAGTETLGQLFSYRFSLISPNDTVDLRELLGSSMAAKLEVGTSYKRHLGGIVTEITQIGFEARDGKRYAAYAALIEPKPWLLSQKIDSRIFKNLSVPDMIRKLLGEIGYSDIELRLNRTYPPCECCVRYREDCLNFISRLMEEEGIYYHFVHGESTHTMVLADSVSAHKSTAGYAELPYSEGGAGSASLVGVQTFAVARSVHITKYALTDHDPLKPRTSFQVNARSGIDGDLHPVAGLESFDFPGDHFIAADGTCHASARIEGLRMPRDRYSGTSNAPGLLPGALFKLVKLPRDDLNVEYRVVGTTMISIKGPPRSAGGSEERPTSLQSDVRRAPDRRRPASRCRLPRRESLGHRCRQVRSRASDLSLRKKRPGVSR
ncbi:type VI secretion system tip protein TssI/VgrG [Nevskia sp.]|uniref:type VI secretion system tip protein TssI/VgrG n=1 Tax=Nevskia sp. TaxID=1929292 RepID=UPI0025ECAD64|nr:type VI secretion system tip protein TssI/VgrG [Nevskia sp.]